jgi:DNA-directed RNA polymerase subunit L
MEIKILEDKKNTLLFEIKGKSHGFCNLLKKELWNNEHVKVAAYRIEHPSIGIPEMMVETDGKDSPRDALLKAVKSLKSTSEKLYKEFKEELK